MDAFAGLDGLGNSGNNKKLSLAEQLKADEANKRKAAQAWDSLDLLDTSFQPKPTQTPSIAPRAAQSRNTSQNGGAGSSVIGSTNQAATSSIADDDVFGLFSSAPPPPPTPQKQQATDSATQPSNGNLQSQPLKQAKPEPSLRTTSPRAQSSVAMAGQSTSSRPSKSSSPIFDRNLAYLVDMGFESEDASRALTAMDNQVSGAVNYLMAEAQGLPLPKPKQSKTQQLAILSNADFGEFGAVATQFGTSMFTKASSLWSKGRKELEKAYSQYNGQLPGDSSQPAWMRDKAKYDARKSQINRGASSGISENTASSSTPSTSVRNNDFDTPNLPSVPRSKSVESRPEDPPMPQRPSRAELFRRKQMERNSVSREQSASPSSGSSTPLQTQAPATHPVIQDPPEPAVDLLNLNGQASQPQLSSSQTDIYSVSRELGSEAYKKGNYESAVEHYTAALSVVPEGNVLRALLLSNRSAALMKAGNARGAFDDTTNGLKLLPNKGAGIEAEGKPMADIWVKLVTRNAQAAEQMEKYEAALSSWQLLLDNGHAAPAILDSKRRCQKAMNPDTVAAAEAPVKPKAKRRGWGTTGAVPSSASGKAALEKVRNEHKQIQEEEKQRELLRDRVSARVDAWKAGNETNLRNLLSTLQSVLWDGSGWTPVAGSDLVVPKKARIVYMKAVSRTHPDKVPANAPMEVRMISESVFVTIQKAWEVFRVENNI